MSEPATSFDRNAMLERQRKRAVYEIWRSEAEIRYALRIRWDEAEADLTAALVELDRVQRLAGTGTPGENVVPAEDTQVAPGADQKRQ